VRQRDEEQPLRGVGRLGPQALFESLVFSLASAAPPQARRFQRHRGGEDERELIMAQSCSERNQARSHAQDLAVVTI